MQEVAVALWRKYGDLTDIAEFRKWAFGVARVEVMAWRRDRGRDRHVFGEEAMAIIAEQSAKSSAQLDVQREALEECLGKLPADQRTLMCAAYAPGVRMDHLAAQQGRTAMALYKSLHRIRLMLVECTRATLAREGLA
jgi:RNA polymerase sigma-70 factor (ECF subfamily)